MEAFGGWLQFGRDGLRRGYFRVAGNLLSAHAGDGFVAERVFSLTAARVVRSRSGQIIVDMIDGRRLRLSGDTEAESKAWFRHLQQCSKRTFSDNYTLQQQWTCGGKSAVFNATCKLTKMNVAVKFLRQTKRNAKEKAQMEAEVQALMSVVHRSVHRTYEIFDDGQVYSVVMERVDGGTLADYVSRKGGLPEPLAARLAWDVVSAVQHLHDLRIIHRDISPGNILLVERDPSTVPVGEPVVKLCDFGHCSLHKPTRRDDKASNQFTCETFVDRYNVIAPEQARREVYSSAVDIWACGVVVYFMIMGDYPFSIHRSSQLFELLRMRRDARVTYGYEWDKVSPLCRRLVEKMLQPSPRKRPIATYCLKSPWFSTLFCTENEGRSYLVESDSYKVESAPSLDGLVKDPNKVSEPLRLVSQTLRRSDLSSPLRRSWRDRKNSFDKETRSSGSGRHRHWLSDSQRSKGSGKGESDILLPKLPSGGSDATKSLNSVQFSSRRLLKVVQQAGKSTRELPFVTIVEDRNDASEAGEESFEECVTPWEEYFEKYEQDKVSEPVEYYLPEHGCQRSVCAMKRSIKRSIDGIFPSGDDVQRLEYSGGGRSLGGKGGSETGKKGVRRGVDEPFQRWRTRTGSKNRSGDLSSSSFGSLVSKGSAVLT